MINRNNYDYQHTEQIIKLCFDAKSLEKMTPGLKLVFAQADPPILVHVEGIDRMRNESLGSH